MIRHSQSQLQPQLQTNIICATLPNLNRITGLTKREGERERERGREKEGEAGRGRELTIKSRANCQVEINKSCGTLKTFLNI
jgi:hypothetical protein